MPEKARSKGIHPFAFLSKWRSLPYHELMSYVLMFASMPMLAYGIKPYDVSIVRTILFTILALYSGFFATLIWNDITDADIDAIVHPDRPIPTGRIEKKDSLLLHCCSQHLPLFFRL